MSAAKPRTNAVRARIVGGVRPEAVDVQPEAGRPAGERRRVRRRPARRRLPCGGCRSAVPRQVCSAARRTMTSIVGVVEAVERGVLPVRPQRPSGRPRRPATARPSSRPAGWLRRRAARRAAGSSATRSPAARSGRGPGPADEHHRRRRRARTPRGGTMNVTIVVIASGRAARPGVPAAERVGPARRAVEERAGEDVGTERMRPERERRSRPRSCRRRRAGPRTGPAFSVALAWTRSPDAVTTSAASRLSTDRP